MKQQLDLQIKAGNGIYIMHYSRKNPNREVKDILFFKNPLNFSFFYFIPGNLRQNKAQPQDIPQNCVESLGYSKAKIKDPWKFHIIFLGHPRNSTLFLLRPRNFTCYFFDIPGNSISSTHLFGFFLEQPNLFFDFFVLLPCCAE